MTDKELKKRNNQIRQKVREDSWCKMSLRLGINSDSGGEQLYEDLKKCVKEGRRHVPKPLPEDAII